MTDQSENYKPGDVVNDHVLTNDGRWVPIGSAAPANWNASPGWTNPQSVVYVQGDSGANSSLAPVTSLVSGIIGILLSWIPIIGIVGWLFGPLALVFGFLGLSRGRAEHKIMSWIGIVLGAITVAICLVYVVVIFGASNGS